MSLAVLARKTRTKQRLKSTTCGNGRSRNGQQGRSVGFVLNMTGRGGGIGLSGMSYKQRGANCRNKQPVPCVSKGCCSGNCNTGQAGTCCTADKIVSQERRADCGECWYGGMSQPAPQMSYRNYINRKANGAYRPGGRACCKTTECPICVIDWDTNNGPPSVPNVGPQVIISVGNNSINSLTINKNIFHANEKGSSCTSNNILSFFKYILAPPFNASKIWTFVLVVPLSSTATSFTLGGMNVPLSNPTIDTQKKIKIYTLDANSNSEIVKYTGYTRQVSISLNNDQKCRKPQVTWKQHPNIAASTITEHRRQSTIRCANGLIKRNPVYLGKTLISNRINAKPVCSWYNPVTCQYESVKGANPLTQNAQCTTTLPIKSRLGYTRINKNWCNTTKSLTVNNSASDQIAKRKQRAFLCPCPEECPIPDNIDLIARYPIPGVNPSSIGLLSGPTTLKVTNRRVVNQAGKQEVCDSTKYKLDVRKASGAQALILTVAYPALGTGFILNPDGTISYDDTEFIKYLINNPELIVASGTIQSSDSFAHLPDIVTFTSKKLGELCAMGYNKLYLMDLSNGPSPSPGIPVPPGADYVPPIIWNIDCCSDCYENKKRQKNRYCYPRPMATGKCRGLIDFSTKSTVACLRKAQCNK
jgi:hypothetical protein